MEVIEPPPQNWSRGRTLQAGSLLGCLAGSDGNDRDGRLLLVGGIFYFHPYLGKIPILTNIFSDGLKPPTRLVYFTYLWTLQPTDRDDKNPLTIPIVTSSTSRTSQYTTQKTNLFVDPQIFHPQKRTQENIHQSPNLEVGVSVVIRVTETPSSKTDPQVFRWINWWSLPGFQSLLPWRTSDLSGGPGVTFLGVKKDPL